MAFLALAACAAIAASPYAGHRIAEVGVRTPSDLVLLRSVGAEPLACFDRGGRQEVLATDRQLLAARAAGMQVRVVIQDVDAAIARSNAQRAEARRSGSGGWFADYRTWGEVNDRLDELAGAYPDLATLFTAGQTHEGRDIRGIRITGRGDASGRGQVLLNGCQHAREWIAVMVPMYLAEHLLTEHDTSTQVAALLAELEVIIIPIVNPDGYEYTYAPSGYRLWRKNRRNNGGGCRGVDLNRNWDIDWAGGDSTSGNTCSDVYTGPAPFSEPEAAAVRDLVATFDRFIAHIDFHSYSQLVLHPWGWTTAPPPNEAVVTDLAARIAEAIGSVHGQVYVPGAPADILYAADGTMQDWTVTQGAFGHTIELRPSGGGGGGFELPPDQIVPTCEENWAGMLELLEFAAYPVSFSFPAGLPGQFVAGEILTVDVEINALAGITIDPDSAMLHLGWGSGPVVERPMEWLGGTSYRATLPTSACGSDIWFAFSAADTGGATYSHPSDGTLLHAMAAGDAGVDGDVTCDGIVSVSDILAIIAAWGDCPAPCNEDLAPDGTVNITDLLYVITSW